MNTDKMEATMEAITFNLTDLDLKYHKDYPAPIVQKDNDILVKVEYSGICGTDVHIIKGAFPCNDKRTFVLGHEFCGIIVDVGKGTHFKKGQRVVVDPNSGCNLCDFCHSGRYNMCQIGGINNTIGIWADGGFAQYALVPDTQVYVLPNDITLEQAALCEPYSCLAHGWDRAAPLVIGQNILILGAGIIGNLWITLLHLQGHRNVTVSELNESRLNQVKKMDTGYRLITPMGLSKEDNLYDVIIDCTGVARAMEQALGKLGPGGKYVLFGCCAPDDTISMKPFEMYKKETSILGVNINPFSFPKALGLLQAMGSRYLTYERLGVRTYKLSEYQKALQDLETGSISKAMFKLN